MAFDIVTQNFSDSAEAGYTFNLILPTGEDSGAKLTILGELSQTVKNYSRKKVKEFQLQQQTAKRKGKDVDPSIEELEEMAVEGALVRLVGWEGITEKGKEVLFSKEKAKEILTTHPWIREAIIDESGDVTNFRPKV